MLSVGRATRPRRGLNVRAVSGVVVAAGAERQRHAGPRGVLHLRIRAGVGVAQLHELVGDVRAENRARHVARLDRRVQVGALRNRKKALECAAGRHRDRRRRLPRQLLLRFRHRSVGVLEALLHVAEDVPVAGLRIQFVAAEHQRGGARDASDRPCVASRGRRAGGSR